MSVVSGLVWCLVILFAQLWLLRYIDKRVAAMPRLQEPPLEKPDGPAAPPTLASSRQEGQLDA
ncbi:hypothetical protein HNO52_11760 [Billgrantia diversa]|uniref:hypothetical protein n=1 Tax=Halomonas sp. MCCC 1A13316 TaxID=2733487 RepID=UPI0018A6160E|nr:hypothetical protein [Halomonas sp. MCCC 1A13316]QOR39114.1 hypothetical protein HNO52_11760 [Halomonas sp. MCCC 1A13316]